jgi:hypothetical protein
MLMLDLSVRDFLIRLRVIWTLDYATRISIMPGFVRCRVVARGEVLPNPPIPFSYILNLTNFPAEKKTLRGKLWELTGETRGVPPLLVLIDGFKDRHSWTVINPIGVGPI